MIPSNKSNILQKYYVAIPSQLLRTCRWHSCVPLRAAGITGRLARSENNLTRLASTLTVRHEVCEAAKSCLAQQEG